MGSLITWLLGGAVAKKALRTDITKPDTPETPAAPAAPAPTTDTQQTGVETTSASLRRKARGKRGLTIQLGSSTGSSGGTGLNI